MGQVKSVQFQFMPRETCTTPRDGEVLTDRWWVTDKDGNLAFFVRAAGQCSRDKDFAEELAKAYNDDKIIPGCKVEFFPIVYLGWRDSQDRVVGIY